MASVHVIGPSLRSMAATEHTSPSGDPHQWVGGGSSPNSSLSSFALEPGLAASSRCLTGDENHPIDEPKRSYSACALSLSSADSTDSIMLGFLERKPYRPFRSNEEYLVAMKEDLAEWFNTLYGLDCCADNFLNRVETGVVLCQHANSVLRKAREWRLLNGFSPFKQLSLSELDLDRDVPVKLNANPGTFQARDNVANFINWCRRIRIHECLLFETEDLVARKNEKSFVLCLLEVARYGAKFGLLAPTLVQFEQEIDQELEQEQQKQLEHTAPESCESTEDVPVVFGPQPQITNNDLESLHEKVVNLLSRCTCPVQFYLEHLSEGKYRIGDTKTLIFVRILRNHVMVRVGGGWDTLEHYLEKHDPCRCRFGHRTSNSARVYLSQQQAAQQQTRNAAHVQVTFERSDPCAMQSPSSGGRRTGQLNPSPVPLRRLTRPNSVTTALNSLSTSDFGGGSRRASTSSNSDSSSLSSVPGCSEPVLQSGPSGSSSPTSGHSSLSSSSSLTQYPSLVLPDRNNNIKGFNGNGFGQIKSSPLPHSTPPPAPPKSSPSKRRAVVSPDANSSPSTRIPKSKASVCTPSQTAKAKPGSGTLSAAHKHKSTSSLAISRIPCLDATNKPGRLASRNQSTHNIYLALSTERDKSTPVSRRLPAPNSAGPLRQRARPTNLTKQKSSIELRNENYFSMSPIAKIANQVEQEVPKKSATNGASRTTAPSPQHRRHHSSSLPRPSKSAQSSPYAKRRDLSLGGRKQSEAKDQLATGPKSRFQGSATSLNSTASTGSSTSSLATAASDSVSNSRESIRAPTVPDSPSAAHLPYSSHHHPHTPSLSSNEPKVNNKSNGTPRPLVEVCSWFERQH